MAHGMMQVCRQSSYLENQTAASAFFIFTFTLTQEGAAVEDTAIIDLYWAREEQALTETELKYGAMCRTIAFNILRDREDTEECVNDTWFRAWTTMPPQRPSILSAFLSRITRNLSLDRYKAARTVKRGSGQLPLALEELGDCVPAQSSVEDEIQLKELTQLLDLFLRNLPEKECCIFLRRYWYIDSIGAIAQRYEMAEGTVKSSLHRTRRKLREYLEHEGVIL